MGSTSQRISRRVATLHKSLQDSGLQDTVRISASRRVKPGHWCRSRRELLLLGNVLSLLLMLVLVHLPNWDDLSDYVRLSIDRETSYHVGYDDLTGMMSAIQTRWPAEGLSAENPVLDHMEAGEMPAGGGAGPGLVRERVMREKPVSAGTSADRLRIEPRGLDGMVRPQKEQIIAAAPKVLETTLKLPEVATSPRLLSETMAARYPRSGLRDRTQGLVVLRFMVEPDGSVSSIRVDQSLSPEFDGEAIRAVQNARFVPGEDGGRPVPTPTRLAFRFVVRH